MFRSSSIIKNARMCLTICLDIMEVILRLVTIIKRNNEAAGRARLLQSILRFAGENRFFRGRNAHFSRAG